MKTKTLLLLLLVSSFSFMSCQKENIEPASVETIGTLNNSSSRESLCRVNSLHLAGTRSKAWEIYHYVFNGQDLTSVFPTCALDNIINFTADGHYIETEGASSCEGHDHEIHIQGHYKYDCENGMILIDTPEFKIDFTIIELTPTRLKVSFYDPFMGGPAEFWLKKVTPAQPNFVDKLDRTHEDHSH